MSNPPTRTIAALLTLLAVLSTLAVSAAAPAAAARVAPHARAAADPGARALARQERQQRRAALRQQRSEAREARRAARESERAARRREREARRAARAAERPADTGQGHESGPTAAGEAHPEEAQAGETHTRETHTGETRSGETHAEETHGGNTQPSHSATPLLDCVIAASAAPVSVTTGEAVTLSGTLSCPEAKEAAEQTLTVYQQERGVAKISPTIAGTATTAADGSFQFRSAPLTTRSLFIVRSAITRHPARAVVPVAAAVSLQGPAASGATLAMTAPAAAGGVAIQTFTGVIRPGQANRQIALRARFAGEAWRTIAFTRTRAEGRFTFIHRFRFAGEVSLMAVARPLGTERAASAVLMYSIAQAQNPLMTIQLSTTPGPPGAAGPAGTAGPPGAAGPAGAAGPVGAAAGGQPATITGVALGSPHKTVTLERVVDGRFASVATVESDASGAYSFTVDPTQTTVYKVICASRRSAPVRVEVNQ